MTLSCHYLQSLGQHCRVYGKISILQMRKFKLLEILEGPSQVNSDDRTVMLAPTSELIHLLSIHFGEERSVEVIIAESEENSLMGNTVCWGEASRHQSMKVDRFMVTPICVILHSPPSYQLLPWAAQVDRSDCVIHC